MTMSAEIPEGDAVNRELEVVDVAADLIRFDTSNFGGGRSNGEREAAEYVGAYLERLGLPVEYFEPRPRRTNVMARVPGRDPSKSALVVHGHLDVVPAVAEDWSVDPFGGIVRDGMLWGRGAVDMKNMDAMILTAVAGILDAGRQPERDIIVTFFADEEDAGHEGAMLVVDERPEWFAGATEAIGEAGGFSITVADQHPAYLLQVGERSLVWLRLTARGTAGHGMNEHTDNAVTRLTRAIARLGETRFPVQLSPATTQLIKGLEELVDDGTTDPDALLRRTGPAARFLSSSLRVTANPTGLTAGYKHNVIPAVAYALVDVRTPPGTEEAALRQIQLIVGEDIEVEIVRQGVGLEEASSGLLYDTAVAALGREDPGVPVLPFVISGGTDNKALSRLGIAGYGFAPLRLPTGFDFFSKFHGVDECVPVDALTFGHRVLKDFLSTY